MGFAAQRKLHNSPRISVQGGGMRWARGQGGGMPVWEHLLPMVRASASSHPPPTRAPAMCVSLMLDAHGFNFLWFVTPVLRVCL